MAQKLPADARRLLEALEAAQAAKEKGPPVVVVCQPGESKADAWARLGLPGKPPGPGKPGDSITAIFVRRGDW